MPAFDPVPLDDRGLVAVSGADAPAWLDNLVTNTVDDLLPGAARLAALLTPQGKILHEFFALRTADGFLLDTLAAGAADLVKRLTLYKLRAKLTIAAVADGRRVVAAPAAGTDGSAWFADPRHPGLGVRIVSASPPTGGDQASYHARRIALGIPEGGRDYTIGDTFPHEANYDLIGGVSFAKGCFVGQEVVARMQNKTVVRRRVVKVTGAAALTAGASVQVADVEIGRVGSIDGRNALALLRLDRAAEAADKGQPLTAGGIAVTPDAEALQRYAKSVAERPVVNL